MKPVYVVGVPLGCFVLGCMVGMSSKNDVPRQAVDWKANYEGASRTIQKLQSEVDKLTKSEKKLRKEAEELKEQSDRLVKEYRELTAAKRHVEEAPPLESPRNLERADLVLPQYLVLKDRTTVDTPVKLQICIDVLVSGGT